MNGIYYLRWRRVIYPYWPDTELLEIVTAAPGVPGFFTWIWHGRPLRGNETPFCFPGQP